RALGRRGPRQLAGGALSGAHRREAAALRRAGRHLAPGHGAVRPVRRGPCPARRHRARRAERPLCLAGAPRGRARSPARARRRRRRGAPAPLRRGVSARARGRPRAPRLCRSALSERLRATRAGRRGEGGLMARDDKDLIVALDIGTSKVACLVSEMRPDGTLEILGMGSHESKGLKKGVVVNIEATVTAIQRALEEAELMADCKIASAFVGIAGSHIKSFNSTGMVAIKDREVSALDVERAIDTARAVNIPTDQQILHVLRQEFIIDGQEDVREPIGMSGVRLEVKVHIVTGAVSAAQNIVKCVRRCGLEVNDLILQRLASSRSVLSEDEKDLGVCLLDIGGGTTDIAIFTHGAIRHTAVIPIAGDQITNDIAMALRTPTLDAEVIKTRHGVALRQLADPNDMIEVPGIGERGSRAMSR